MDDKKDTDKNVPEEEKKQSPEQKLDDEQLDVSGGVLVITGCPKCNKVPCECLNLS